MRKLTTIATKRPVLLTALSAFALLCACNEEQRVDASDFSQTCEVHADCVAVTTDACLACQPCGPDAAINVRDLSEFQAARADIRCRGELSDAHCNNACMPSTAECVRGKCRVVWEDE